MLQQFNLGYVVCATKQDLVSLLPEFAHKGQETWSEILGFSRSRDDVSHKGETRVCSKVERKVEDFQSYEVQAVCLLLACAAPHWHPVEKQRKDDNGRVLHKFSPRGAFLHVSRDVHTLDTSPVRVDVGADC